MSGVLFVVATPIGNLEDVSRRALAVLAAADIIACEDTRHSRRLLDAYGIDRPLLPLHQHNERGAAQALLQRLQEGANVALVSDAGTPLVSDPGALLTHLAHEAGIRVCPVPGASSVIAALSASGLPADRFQFAGFIPAKAGERQRFFAEFAAAAQTTIFFETPHRIAESLAAMAEIFDGARRLVVARELTKQFEQIALLTVASAASSCCCWKRRQNRKPPTGNRWPRICAQRGCRRKTPPRWLPNTPAPTKRRFTNICWIIRQTARVNHFFTKTA